MFEQGAYTRFFGCFTNWVGAWYPKSVTTTDNRLRRTGEAWTWRQIWAKSVPPVTFGIRWMVFQIFFGDRLRVCTRVSALSSWENELR